MPMTKQ